MLADQEAPSFSQLSIRLAALSHPGALSTNEDACGVIDAPRGSVIVLADGAGGHVGGEVASELVVRRVGEYVRSLGDFKPDGTVVAGALRAAQQGLREAMVASPKLFDMRSTGLIVLTTRARVWVGHVGDSRAYLIRGGEIRQLTRDDTLVQALVDMGQITMEQARNHAKANVLLQSLGEARDDIEFHVSESLEAQVGDVLVACSDGLPDVLEDSEIAELAAKGTSKQIAERLIAKAIAGGAPDNVTVSVVCWRRRAKGGSLAPSIAASGRVVQGKKRARAKRDLFPVIAAVAVIATALVLAAAVRAKRAREAASVQTAGETGR